MSIFDKLKNHKADKVYEAMNAEAIKIFDRQKEGLKGISKSEGYKQIKEYFEAVKESALKRVMVSGNATAKAQYTLADDFLKFLASREK